MWNDPILTFVLAQEGDGQPLLPLEQQGTGNGTQQQQQQDANGGGGGGGGGAGAFPDMIMILIIVMGVVIVFSMLGGRRERKRKEAMLNAIKKHDKVQTIGGIVGTVVNVSGDQIVLKVDESSNTRITFSRSSIAQVLNSSSSGKDAE